MSKRKHTLLNYSNQELMNKTNDLFIRIKVHLFDLGNETTKLNHSKPSNKELDSLMNLLFIELKKDNVPFKN